MNLMDSEGLLTVNLSKLEWKKQDFSSVQEANDWYSANKEKYIFYKDSESDYPTVFTEDHSIYIFVREVS